MSARPSREQCLAAAGRALAAGILRMVSLDPHTAAEAAYMKGGPTVAELEQRIREFHARARLATAQ